MFGSPLFSSLILLTLFGLGGSFALVKVTRKEAKKAKVEHSKSEYQEKVMTWITVRSAHPLESASLTLKEKEITLERISEKEFEAEVELPRISDLFLSVTWAVGSPESAVLISLEPDALQEWSKTVWGEGSLKEELSYNFYATR